MPKLLEIDPIEKRKTIFDSIKNQSLPEALKTVLMTFSESLAPKVHPTPPPKK